MAVMSQILGKELQTFGEGAQMKLQMVKESCYLKSKENADRFVECLMNNQKGLDHITDSFQFKMAFVSRNAQQCVAKGKSANECGE